MKKYLIFILILLSLSLCGCQKGQQEPVPNVPEKEEEIDTEYISPIDFSELQKKNPDIYAWITIPGTNVDYPVLQSQTDDEFYLDHDDEAKFDLNGVLFSEHSYNNNKFTDPVTIVYGHHLKSGEMFGNLQKYYTDSFEDLREITVYTPVEEQKYEVFAAVPYSNRHILYYYDCFKTPEAVKEFIEDVKGIRAIGAQIDKEYDVDKDDQLLVLSTCLQADRTKRFIVVAKRVDLEERP